MAWVDAAAVAKAIGTDRVTVIRWAKAGRIPAHVLRPLGSGNRAVWRFDINEVKAAFANPRDEQADAPRTLRAPRAGAGRHRLARDLHVAPVAWPK